MSVFTMPCPHCRAEMVPDASRTCTCPDCGRSFVPMFGCLVPEQPAGPERPGWPSGLAS